MVVFAWLVAVGAVVLAAALIQRSRAEAATVADSLRALDLVLDHAPVGVAVLDTDLRFVRANRALTRLSGQTAEELLGHTLTEVTRGRSDIISIAEAVLATGSPQFGLDASGRSTQGRSFRAVADFYPIRADDRILGIGVIVHDITAAARVDEERRRLLERLSKMQRITETLALARTTDDVVRTVIEDFAEAAGATAATLVLGDEHPLRILGTSNDRASVDAWLRSLGAGDSQPVVRAMRERRVLVVGPDELAAHWPAVSRVLPFGETILAVPLLDESSVLGGIVLRIPPPGDGQQDEVFLTAASVQITEALRRVLRDEKEHAAHAASEAKTARLAFVAEASEALASSLDWRITLRRVVDLFVPRIADCAVALAVDGDEIVATEVAAAATGDGSSDVVARWLPSLLGDRRVEHAPFVLGDVGSSTDAATGALAGAGVRSLLTVPMRANGSLVGLLALVTTGPRTLGDADAPLAEEVAARAGQALRNAARFQERSHVADTLQASLLPPVTPSVPGLEVATRFFAVGEGIDVGGDFYDVFRLGTASAPRDEWAVVIGDVRGKGPEAARISGTARHAIRAAALYEQSPAAILRQLNELLLVTGGDDLEPRFCTAVVAVLTPMGDAAAVCMAVAGHPAPFLLRSDGTTEQVPTRGAMLGVFDDPEVTDTQLALAAGDALVLYTDGVTERHVGGRFFDEDAFASVLSRCTGFTAPVLAERIETASRAFLEDLPSDDLAVVVVRVPEPLASASAASTDLPNDVTAPMLGRRFVAAALTALGLEQHAETASLLASELVTNALMHAEAPYRIAVESGDGVLRIGVTDATIAAPHLPSADEDATSGRGIHLVDTLTARWGVQTLATGKTVWFELGT
jgi:PAS domain S-box-containing protein